ncbi:hypothetical protein [Saccharothrix syringae]|uniref:DUF4267 domain-containing protein n=1 Tax=Saccharothrix syringae TaxID=103733 RepID=A0A5Q0H5D5_SACSY|nr:hypothetical protein [Saccharothrix syringae]QFZ21095.1 hypothetical protein EKG83_30245 [Saccharothrix syringae]
MNRSEQQLTRLATAHGLFNLVGGLWPAVSVRAFELVFGRKTDRWLQRTTGGLLAGIGWAQLRASAEGDWRQARRIGAVAATTLLAIDLLYVPKGRIGKVYLADAACEAAWLAAWAVKTRNR